MYLNKLISIIVPIYKVEMYLDECIQSLINQTYKNLEIILVDDGSPDNCPQMCDEWSQKDQRIKVIHKTNGGLSSARNAGIEQAQGDFIGFVDSDDFIDSRMYEYLINGFSDESIGITSCLILQYNNNKIKPFENKWHITTERIISYKDFAEQTILTKINFTVWSKLYRSSLIKDVRFRINRLNEDTLFMFDLSSVLEAKKLNMKELPYYCYYYRMRDGSICNNNITPLDIEVIRNFNEMADYYLKINPKLSKKIKDYSNIRLIHFVWKLKHAQNINKDLYTKYKTILNKIPINESLRIITYSRRTILRYIFTRLTK